MMAKLCVLSFICPSYKVKSFVLCHFKAFLYQIPLRVSGTIFYLFEGEDIAWKVVKAA